MSVDVTRVLMTADAVGGVWTFALELAAALARHDVATTVAVMGPPPSDAQLHAARRIRGVNVEVGDYPLEWMDDPWADVERAGPWLLALEERLAAEIVHLNGFVHGALPWRSPVLVAGHSCVLSWADATGHELPADHFRTYHDAVARGLRAADHVVAPSRAMAAALCRYYGPLERVAVIPNGRSNIAKAARKEPFVFTAGRLWDVAKNVDAVVAVAPDVAWPVVLAGDGGARFDADATVQSIGRLEPQELGEWLARASVFALPARYEPFGLLPLEAALAGCALVLGDIPSLREVWGDAATYVHPDDHGALLAALNALIENPMLLQERAGAARQRARRYPPGRMAGAYRNLYRSLAASSASTRRIACAS